MSPSVNSVIEKKKKMCKLNRKEIIADLNDTSNISWTLKKKKKKSHQLLIVGYLWDIMHLSHKHFRSPILSPGNQ